MESSDNFRRSADLTQLIGTRVPSVARPALAQEMAGRTHYQMPDYDRFWHRLFSKKREKARKELLGHYD